MVNRQLQIIRTMPLALHRMRPTQSRSRPVLTTSGASFKLVGTLELDGEDLRQLPIEQRKARLAKLLTGAPSTVALNESAVNKA